MFLVFGRYIRAVVVLVNRKHPSTSSSNLSCDVSLSSAGGG